MNTLLFLCGAGVGAFVSTCLFLVLINVLLRNRKTTDRRAIAANEASIAELKRRNDIGEQELTALRDIASELERYFNQPNG